MDLKKLVNRRIWIIYSGLTAKKDFSCLLKVNFLYPAPSTVSLSGSEESYFH